jgi:hypothetical protein
VITIFLASILLGAVAGLMAGLFGIGGGLVIVPILAVLFAAEGFPAELVMIMSVATSLATIVITSISSVTAHHRLKSVGWDKVLALGPGIIVGAAVGSVIADHIADGVLRFMFTVYLLAVGLQTWAATTFKTIGFGCFWAYRPTIFTFRHRRRDTYCAFFSALSNAHA